MSLSLQKKKIAQLFGKKYRKMVSGFFPNKMVVKDRHMLGKNRPLSNFHQIMIMLLGVNNEHVSESKFTYFLEGEKRKYVNHEI